MAKFMWIAGILFAAAGLAMGVIVLFPTVPVNGVTLETAIICLVGGMLAIGMGTVIDGHDKLARSQAQVSLAPASAATEIPEFDPRNTKPAAPETSAQPDVVSDGEMSQSTRDMIGALDVARTSIEQVFKGKAPSGDGEPVSSRAAAAASGAPPLDEEAVVSGQLYVIDERIIRHRPARILSDGTVEAETEDGWMRFENLEHLDEYLDAMEQERA
ncbi:hypothetical protein [Aestuariivirga sp.]|jgi:hypothetical protein|uniref:hypothetical protein n=1 Tax=Aestuariivirga sp. TaxID=2650926 RepID=UPI003784BCBA